MAHDTSTADRLRSLIRLYDHQCGQNQVVDQVVHKLFDLEIQRAREDLDLLQTRLTAWEQRHGLSSEEFYRQFRAGMLGDAVDYVEWSSFWDMYQAAQRRLNDLMIQAA